MATQENIQQQAFDIFSSLWADIANRPDNFPTQRPLLAHYTSISTLEQLMKNDEMWFSNPLFMNDYEEVRVDVVAGSTMFRESKDVRDACGSDARYEVLRGAFEKAFNNFDQLHAFDTYVFCFSEHDPDDYDGRLSMWRGYGANGNGAAVVIDSSRINFVATGSPLIFSKVSYLSRKERDAWITKKIIEFAQIIKTLNPPTEMLPMGAFVFFDRLKLFALFTKHPGFKEENEWRVVYLPERDLEGKLKSMLHYTVGPKGIEFKLKFKVRPIAGLTAPDLSLEKLVERVILGPSQSDVLSSAAVKRMFETINKGSLIRLVHTSKTPFRPR